MTRRALYISIILHVAWVAAAVHWLNRDEHEVELVDIEMAPAPPIAEALPAEVAHQLEQAHEEDQAAAAASAAAAAEKPSNEPGEAAAIDAGVDAPIDAAMVANHEDARVDASQVAKVEDASVDAPQVAKLDDAGEQIAKLDDAGSGAGSDLLALGAGSGSDPTALGSGAGSDRLALAGSGTGSGSGSGQFGPGGDLSGSGHGSALGDGSAGSGSPAATTTSSGMGFAAMDDQPAVEGAPTSAGTAANLLAYFPPGHTLSVLVRFDRLRGTEWSLAAEELFRPMPDYQSLFGTRNAGIADKLDMLVISTPRPRDATATTLVMQTHLPRSSIRDLLTSTTTPIKWTATRGGALGTRSGRLFANDTRVVLSPWQGWYVLAPQADLANLTTAAKGSVDSVEATAKLPPWLAGIRSIVKEAGVKDPGAKDAGAKQTPDTGPALVMTVGDPPSDTAPAKSGRYKLPELGLGVRSLPVPSRISLAMELVKQGWLVRGNIVFASEADAAELVTTLGDLRKRITDSYVMSGILKRQHALNVIKGLSMTRSGARVSYATSISISDARAILAAAAQTLGGYFGQLPP